MSKDISFKNGDVNIKEICFQGGGSIRVKKPITKIEVVMEWGQMAGVPWLAVYEGEKVISKYNAALIESVGY